MFNPDQEVFYKTDVPARIIAQRVYTDRYTHWDIEIMEDVIQNGVRIAFKGFRHLGVPEGMLKPFI